MNESSKVQNPSRSFGRNGRRGLLALYILLASRFVAETELVSDLDNACPRLPSSENLPSRHDTCFGLKGITIEE
jgi:hypothetical protein